MHLEQSNLITDEELKLINDSVFSSYYNDRLQILINNLNDIRNEYGNTMVLKSVDINCGKYVVKYISTNIGNQVEIAFTF